MRGRRVPVRSTLWTKNPYGNNNFKTKRAIDVRVRALDSMPAVPLVAAAAAAAAGESPAFVPAKAGIGAASVEREPACSWSEGKELRSRVGWRPTGGSEVPPTDIQPNTHTRERARAHAPARGSQ